MGGSGDDGTRRDRDRIGGSRPVGRPYHGRASTSPPPSTTSTTGRTSGTAYEKIAADVIARYKRLAGFDVRFVMGNDEHSQNVFRKRARAGARRRSRTATGWSSEFRDVWSRLNISFDDFIRTTEPRHKRAVADARAALVRGRRHLRGRLRGLVLRLLRGVQAGERPGRRPVSDPPDRSRTGSRRRTTSSASRSIATALLAHYDGASRRSSSPSRGATRCCGCSKAASKTSRSAARGSRGAFRCRSIRRASSTSGTTRSSTTPRPSATARDEALFDTWWPADLHLVGKDITRFHCVVWPAMLMSAGVAAAAPGLRPRLGAVQGREDEQVARHDASIRSRRRIGSAPIRCGWYLTTRDRLRSGRRLLVGAVREVVQRRPGEQPRQPRQPRDVDGAPVSRRRAARARRRGRDARRRRRESRRDATGEAMDELDARPRRRGVHVRSSTRPTSSSPTSEPWKLAKAGDDTRARRRAVERERSAAHRGGAALAVHARVGDEILRRLGVDRDVRRLCVSTATPSGRPTATRSRSAGRRCSGRGSKRAGRRRDRRHFDQGETV